MPQINLESIANLHIGANNQSGWDAAITDAEKRIEEARERIKWLRRSVASFRKLRDSGEPFPSESQSEASQ